MLHHSTQDGDTATVVWEPPMPMIHRIRLADIDAPERGEALFDTSRQHLHRLMQAGPLRLEFTNRHGIKPEVFNRLVGYIWAGEILVNAALVMVGLAVVYLPKGHGQHTARLFEEMKFARENKLGIWAIPNHRLCRIAGTPFKK